MDRLSDRYRLVDCIGTGGMSVVWLARDEILGRDVVVKLLGPQRPGDTSSRHLIRQEALSAAGLSHPNVTTVYDYGEVNFPDGETVPFVVMEFVPGRTLSARLAEGPMPWREAVRMAAEVSAALAAAHQHGLVHRDVKPANVMLTPVGAKVLDFGIAAAVGTPDEGDILLGTPAYVAPERLAGGAVHPSADVYAVGLLLYKALTGHLPWNASTATQILKSHRWVAPAPLPDIPGMPPGVAKLCLQCLSKKPANRPDSVELASRLAELAGIRVALPDGGRAGGDNDRTGGGDRAGHHAAASEPTGGMPTRTGPLDDFDDGDPTHAGASAASGPAWFVRWWHGHRPRPRSLALIAAGTVIALVLFAGLLSASGGRPQRATAAGTAGLGARPAACDVRYLSRTGGGQRFAVDLTITNTGTAPLSGWRLNFDFPAGQRLVTSGTGWLSQSGSTVTVRDAERDARLDAGASTTVGFAAVSPSENALPTGFTLNGAACGQTVLAAGEPAPSRTTATPATGGQGAGHAKGKGDGKGKGKGRR